MRIRSKRVNTLLSLLYPPHCIFCDEILPFGEQEFCRECERADRYLMGSTCMKCGKALSEETEEYCKDCRDMEHYYIRGFSLYNYERVKDALYRFKYAGRQEYGDFFGKELAMFMGKKLSSLQLSGIIPVPMYEKKEKIRGYNQAKCLAYSLGRELNIPVYDHLVQRMRNTTPLKNLNPEQRRNNLKNAFHITSFGVKLDNIVIVDDIYTTGSTVDEIARVLMEYGCKNVYVVTLAIGVGI